MHEVVSVDRESADLKLEGFGSTLARNHNIDISTPLIYYVLAALQ